MSTPHPLGGRVLWAHLHWTGKRVDPRDGPRPALETDRRDQNVLAASESPAQHPSPSRTT